MMLFEGADRDGGQPTGGRVLDHRARLLASLDEHGVEQLPTLIERRLVEWWFLLEHAELNALLDRVPTAALARSPLASALFVLTGGSASSSEKDALLRARVDGAAEVRITQALKLPADERLAVALLWRLRGRTRDALRLAQSAAPRGPSPLLADPSAGWAAFVASQTATTAALAGELEVARDALQFVFMARHPRSLAFQLRSAYVLSAVLDATFGEPARARENLALARAVPRTQSWVESVIDARVESVERLLTGRDKATMVALSGPDAHGELWPYTALAVGDSAMLSGRFRDLETHAARLSRVMQRDPRADGLPATALPWLRAVVALEEVRLDDARAFLDECDPAVPLTSLGRAVLTLRRHEPESALRCATEVEERAGGYERLIVAARYLRAEALVMLGRESDAVPALESIPAVSDWVLDHTVVAVSATLIDAVKRPAFRASGAPAVAALARARERGVPLPQAPLLTSRQREILHLLRLGHSRSEIAAALHVSPNTVKTHLRMLFERLEATSRDEAVTKALAWGLVT